MILNVEVIRLSNNTISTSILEELDNRKQALYFNEKQIIRMQKSFEYVLSRSKEIHGFEALKRGYYTIDWYDNVNGYDLPVFTFINGQKNYYMDTHHTVPKEWELIYTLRLNNIRTISGINTFLNLFKINLNETEKEEIRKVIRNEKDGTYFSKKR